MASKKQIDELEITLQKRAEIILSNINDSRDAIDDLKNSECNDEFDYAEVSSGSFKEGIIANKQLDELKEIQAALKKIKNETYGICIMCDENISIKRLKAKPFAKYCTPCREIYEKEQKL